MFEAIGMEIVRTRGYVGQDACWIVKTRGFVGLDVGGSEKTRVFVDPDVWWIWTRWGAGHPGEPVTPRLHEKCQRASSGSATAHGHSEALAKLLRSSNQKDMICAAPSGSDSQRRSRRKLTKNNWKSRVFVDLNEKCGSGGQMCVDLDEKSGSGRKMSKNQRKTIVFVDLDEK